MTIEDKHYAIQGFLNEMKWDRLGKHETNIGGDYLTVVIQQNHKGIDKMVEFVLEDMKEAGFNITEAQPVLYEGETPAIRVIGRATDETVTQY